MPKENQSILEIIRAIRENNVDDVKYLIKMKLKINKEKSTATSSFSFSCMSENIIKQCKHDLEVITMEAALQKDPTILKYLITKGLNINFSISQSSPSNKNLKTPLLAATENGLHQSVEVLLEGNANVNAVDPIGRTPLHYATGNCDVILTRLLLAHGANVKVVDKKGKTPLQLASKFGHVDLVRVLLDNNAKLFEEKQKGYSPLHIAAIQGHVPLLDMFCHCVDIDIVSECDEEGGNDRAALHLACEHGFIEVVRFIVERFAAKINIQDSVLNNPLHYAVIHQHNPKKMRCKESFNAVVEYLIKCKVAINQQNFKGDTPLHLAVSNQHHHAVELMLMSGASPHIKNKSGHTPKDLIASYDATMKQTFIRCAPFSAAYLTLSDVISNNMPKSPSLSVLGRQDKDGMFSSPPETRENLLQPHTNETQVQKYKTVVQTSYDI